MENKSIKEETQVREVDSKKPNLLEREPIASLFGCGLFLIPQG